MVLYLMLALKHLFSYSWLHDILSLTETNCTYLVNHELHGINVAENICFEGST